MKNTLLYPLLFCAAALFAACSGSDDDPTQTGEFITIPDPAFEAYCLEKFDKNGDGKLREGEVNTVTWLHVYGKGIKSLEGIEHFTMLKKLWCEDNELTSIDISKNFELIDLACYSNQLTAIDISNNLNLIDFDCGWNQLASLDVSKNLNLGYLDCSSNAFDSIDVSNNLKLNILYCMCLNLKDLDLTKNTALEELYCEKNQLRDLDLSQNTRLKHLECQHNSLYSLDLTNNPHITELRVNNNKLNVQLDLSQNKALTWMYCYDNPHLRTVYVWEGWSRAAMRDWGTDMSASTIVKP